MRIFKRKKNGDDLYKADRAVRLFCARHEGALSKRQHKKLRKLLDRRAAAISDCIGIPVHSVDGK